MNHLLIHENMQTMLYNLNIFNVSIEWNLYEIGHLYVNYSDASLYFYDAPCRIPLINGIFSLTSNANMVGYILVIRNEIVQLFD